MLLKQRRIMRRHDNKNCLTLSEEQAHVQFNECFVILFSSFLVHSVKQTVKIMIRHRIMPCLILVFAVCLYPVKRTEGFYGQLFSSGTEKRNVCFGVK